MTLIQMSTAGAVMILAVTVIRALTIDRLPKKTFLALWAVVLMRLLIPFSLPSSLSIYSLLDRGRSMMEEAPPLVLRGTAGGLTSTAQILTEPAPRGLSPWTLLWLAGALAVGLFFAVSYWRCRREFRTSLPVDDDFIESFVGRHPAKRRISVRQSSLVASPLTYGIFRPVILLPKSMDLEDKEALEHILTHEYVHIRRFDAVTKLIIVAALCVHWFDPLVWVMYVLANRNLELSCDEQVLRILGDTSRSAYARTLIHMEETKPDPSPLCSHFSKNALEERIVAIMKTKKTTIWTAALSEFLVTGIILAFATSAQAEDASHQAEDGSSIWSGVTILEGGSADKSGIAYWTAEEYEAWLQKEKAELQALVGTESGWYDGDNVLHHFTQEAVDQQIADYEAVLQRIRKGEQVSKPFGIDTDGDGEPDTCLSIEMSEPSVAVSYSQEVDVPGDDGPVTNYLYAAGDAASEDFSEDALGAFAELMKKYEKWGITYSTEDGGKVYYQGKLIHGFVDEDKEGNVMMVSTEKGGGDTVMHTVYDESGNITGVEAE